MIRAVLLDALGTMLELEQPGPHLADALACRGIRITDEHATQAMWAEIGHYQAHHDRASTREGLSQLRAECARVMLDAVGDPASGLDAIEGVRVLMESVRFRAYPDTLPALEALRERGLKLAVVSNWDVSLHDALAQTGIAERVDLALSSAEVGSAKPAPGLLLAALKQLGVDPADALMAGDTVAGDVAGAQAAGVRPVLVERSRATGLGSAGAGEPAPEGVAVVGDLRRLVDLL